LYVAEKYGKPPLWPATVEGHGACYQWSLWCMTEVETPMIEIFQHRLMLPADQRDEKIALARIETLKTPFKVLDDHLRKSEYLLGKDFTIADLNVGSVWSLGTMVGFDFSSAPKTKAWLAKLAARPANQRAAQNK
jgi:glutathione S-transferase